MCGFFGASIQNKKVENDDLQQRLNNLLHRGPDDNGVFIDRENNLFLGHRRLSIIDLSKQASQPMSNEDKSIWIVFNGEIYNHMSLRMELKSKAHIFKTHHADSESIIHGYEEWGKSVLHKLRGMFAFAIYDKRRKIIFAARDRCGQKPFYYFFNDEDFAFASELKAMVDFHFFYKRINSKALADYLCLGFIPAPKSIWQNTYKLSPGEFLVYKLNSKKITKSIYWEPNFEPDYSRNEKYWLDGLKERLEESVKLRTISDVPIGALLSGGVDSSTIVALLSKIVNFPKTFTVAFQDKYLDESGYANIVAKYLNTNHTNIDSSSLNVSGIFKNILWHFDEPFNDYSYFPTYQVCREISKYLKVALSGDGGDEVFCGYPRYNSVAKIYKLNNVFFSLGRGLFYLLNNICPSDIKGKQHIFRLKKGKDYYIVTASCMGLVNREELKDLLKNQWCLDIGDYDPTEWLRTKLDKLSKKYEDIYGLMRAFDFKYSLPERMLTKVDRCSMANSLEVRSPLLDHKFIEFAAKIPPKYLIKNGENKYIFKKLAASMLPKDVIYRKKQGFQAPLKSWLCGEYGNKYNLKDHLDNLNFISKSYLDKGFYTQYRKKENKFLRERSNIIQSIIFLEEWAKKWYKKNK